MDTPENILLLSVAFPLLDHYTPMTREEWERNMAIVEKVMGEVFGHE